MYDFEKLGAFYLGKRINPADDTETDELVLYDSKDLTTHAVIIGMTGSGKTGLGIGLLEEAVLDHVPVIAIDPKGDIANLKLTFPNLAGEDFAPWVNERQANDAGQTPDEFAGAQASLWKSGLAKWGQDGARVAKLRASADVTIYTPGSSAGTPVSVLKSFAAPHPSLLDDTDLYRERIQATATGILSLLDIDADPISSREHILLSQIFDHFFASGRGLDIAGLIGAIQNPPIERVGVMDVESFYPSAERFKLAMRLNNLLAAPGFASWLDGETLEPARFFNDPDGKPRVSIFSTAHLNDRERMFFVTMLLGEIVAWMRAQPGTSSLRAILYMDEIFGYLPPTKNPPSKDLFLTLLKQARAYGLGLVLATQNPVDLDYKALSNAGTWFIGRLQTERDKARVMEGLEGTGGAQPFDRQTVERTLAGLGKRRFLMHNVHEDEDVVFSTRWVMSYLAGPMTRDQIRRLTEEQDSQAGEPATPVRTADASANHGAAPAVPPAVRQMYLSASSAEVTYFPQLLGLADYVFSSARYGIELDGNATFSVEADEGSVAIDWDGADRLAVNSDQLEADGVDGASFAECPASLMDAKRYPKCERAFKTWVRQNETLSLYRSRKHRLTSEAGETEGEFRTRLQLTLNEKRDEAIARIRKRYASKATTLENRLLRAEQRIESQQQQSSQRNLDTAISFGTAILGAVLGRKRLSATTTSRVGTAVRRAGAARRKRGDVERARETAAKVREDIEALNAALEDEIDALEASYDAQEEPLHEVVIKAKAADISIVAFGLVWMPYRRSESGQLEADWR